MYKHKKKWIICLILFLTIWILIYTFTIYERGLTRHLKLRESVKIESNDLIFGNVNSSNFILAFLSLDCVHCKHWVQFDLKPLDSINLTDLTIKNLKIVVRGYPLNFSALQAQSLINCLPSDLKNQSFIKLIENQEIWTHLPINEQSSKQLSLINIKENQEILSCAQDRKNLQNIVEDNVRSNRLYQVTATPSFLSDKILVVGDHSLKKLTDVFKLE